jgi:hypothetical protein
MSHTRPNLKREAPARSQWRQWGEILRRHHLEGLAGWMLDAGRPLALLSAQLLYMGGPFLGAGAGRLAELLESGEDSAALAQYLDLGGRDEPPPHGESR